MSLDKAIEHGKEKRKQYRGSKAIDRTCRNHGTCNYCQMKSWYEFNDGWFTYYVNVKTGEKKFKLDNGDNLVEFIQDDFMGGAE